MESKNICQDTNTFKVMNQIKVITVFIMNLNL